jgi:large subunit ribosomal protein L24
MKKQFSTSWLASKQPRKQRKYRANANSQRKQAMMSSNMSKDLRKKYSKRSISIKKGDTVRVMSGEYSGKTGKISIVDMAKMKVYIEGIQAQKKDGTKINVPFYPSRIQITELLLDDPKREASLKRKNIPLAAKNKEAKK